MCSCMVVRWVGKGKEEGVIQIKKIKITVCDTTLVPDKKIKKDISVLIVR